MPDTLFPIYLIHGGLGAGKTSLVKDMLTTDKNFKSAIVIENEFAAENIDAQILSNHIPHSNILEISGGCICCSSSEELISVLQQISQKITVPVPVIIETTGVAS